MVKRRRAIAVTMILVIAFMLFGCGSTEEPTTKLTTVEVDISDAVSPETPRHTLKSTLTDWTAEYAVTYIDVEYVDSWHGKNACVNVEIVNTGNNPIDLMNFLLDGYTVTDNNGDQKEQLFDVCFPYIVYPGEKGYLFGCRTWLGTSDLNVTLNTNSFADTCLTTDEALQLVDNYTISDLSIHIDENENVEITGKVTNNFTEDDGTKVPIYGVVLDKDGQPLCVVLGIVDSLAAGEVKEFTASAYTCGTVDLSNVGEYKVEAYRNN